MKKIRLLSAILALCLPLTTISISASSQNNSNDLILINYNQQAKISLSSIKSSIDKVGKTVTFYGKHLNVDEIIETYFSDTSILKLNEPKLLETEANKNMSELDGSDTINSGTLPVTKTTDINSTYAIISTNVNNKIMLSYYSFTYDPIASDDMEYYFDEALSVNNIKNISNEFSSVQQRKAMTRGTIVQDIQDNNTFFDYYYPTGMNNSYLMKMYKKTITYQAVKVNDAISDYDFYYIVPYVRITPGNSLSQQYSQYKNAIVVIGSQTDINRKYTVDSLIDGTPDNSTVEAMKPKNYSYSLSVGMDGTVSIGFSWTPTNKVTRTTTFDQEYFNNFYGGQDSSRKWCISTTQFSYRMGAYLRSQGSYFAFDVNTQVKTLFQNEALSSARWSSNPMTLSYSA